ncbi:MAG TPA: hypothetical protein VKU00_08710 [Chthonomonadaceae bacterium]|nr:hypothetical protein [Chthonomonadaceae bacterium]
MNIEELGPDTLWKYYQRGYHSLMRSGIYFRSILRPALSHAYFQRAVPLLAEYAQANRNESDLPPGFGDRLQACPLTPRDLLHLDYAICLGYAEAVQSHTASVSQAPVMDWPGLGVDNGIFIPADALQAFAMEELPEEFTGSEEEYPDEDEDEESKPPFDL